MRRKLEVGFSRVYQWWLLKSLKNKLSVKFAGAQSPINLDEVWGCRTFRVFDDLVTAPLHGFRDADHYYQQVSARRFLGAISTPTLIIHAEDDPFMTTNVLATPHEVSPRVEIETTPGGPHWFHRGSGAILAPILARRTDREIYRRVTTKRGRSPLVLNRLHAEADASLFINLQHLDADGIALAQFITDLLHPLLRDL